MSIVPFVYLNSPYFFKNFISKEDVKKNWGLIDLRYS